MKGALTTDYECNVITFGYGNSRYRMKTISEVLAWVKVFKD